MEDNALKMLIKALKEQKDYYEKCCDGAYDRFKRDDSDMITYIQLRICDAQLHVIYHILDLVRLYGLDEE